MHPAARTYRKRARTLLCISCDTVRADILSLHQAGLTTGDVIKTNLVHKLNSKQNAVPAAACSVLVILAETNPDVVANRLVLSPNMANGLKDFKYIVSCLLEGGQREKLITLLQSDLLGMYESDVLILTLSIK